MKISILVILCLAGNSIQFGNKSKIQQGIHGYFQGTDKVGYDGYDSNVNSGGFGYNIQNEGSANHGHDFNVNFGVNGGHKDTYLPPVHTHHNQQPPQVDGILVSRPDQYFPQKSHGVNVNGDSYHPTHNVGLDLPTFHTKFNPPSFGVNVNGEGTYHQQPTYHHREVPPTIPETYYPAPEPSPPVIYGPPKPAPPVYYPPARPVTIPPPVYGPPPPPVEIPTNTMIEHHHHHHHEVEKHGHGGGGVSVGGHKGKVHSILKKALEKKKRILTGLFNGLAHSQQSGSWESSEECKKCGKGHGSVGWSGGYAPSYDHHHLSKNINLNLSLTKSKENLTSRQNFANSYATASENNGSSGFNSYAAASASSY